MENGDLGPPGQHVTETARDQDLEVATIPPHSMEDPLVQAGKNCMNVRSRSCNSPALMNGGKTCPGDGQSSSCIDGKCPNTGNFQFSSCTGGHCITNGMWGLWTSWSTCGRN